tara:strand:- start:1128 stop:1526 length:399 start_codon:yes stop_codon:yes gene_type:complete
MIPMQAIAVQEVRCFFIIVDRVQRTGNQFCTCSTWTIKVPGTYLATLLSNGVKPRLTPTVCELTGAGFTETIGTTCVPYTVHTVKILLTESTYCVIAVIVDVYTTGRVRGAVVVTFAVIPSLTGGAVRTDDG